MQILNKLILPDKSLTHFFDQYRFWPLRLSPSPREREPFARKFSGSQAFFGRGQELVRQLCDKKFSNLNNHFLNPNLSL
jgi:hypothetical protein